MGRSVSRPNNAIHTAFQDWTDAEDSWDFDFRIEDIVYEVRRIWESMTPTDEWLGREDRAIAENDHAYIGISEYCGLACVWMVPKESEYQGLTDAWCARAGDKFYQAFSELRSIGRASNGEEFFERLG